MALCLFTIYSTSFASRITKPVEPCAMNILGRKACLLGTSKLPYPLCHYFLGVNQNGPKTNSTTNHKFYEALGRLHGPWFIQPLS